MHPTVNRNDGTPLQPLTVSYLLRDRRQISPFVGPHGAVPFSLLQLDHSHGDPTETGVRIRGDETDIEDGVDPQLLEGPQNGIVHEPRELRQQNFEREVRPRPRTDAQSLRMGMQLCHMCIDCKRVADAPLTHCLGNVPQILSLICTGLAMTVRRAQEQVQWFLLEECQLARGVLHLEPPVEAGPRGAKELVFDEYCEETGGPNCHRNMSAIMISALARTLHQTIFWIGKLSLLRGMQTCYSIEEPDVQTKRYN